jgi:hypothetical protein
MVITVTVNLDGQKLLYAPKILTVTSTPVDTTKDTYHQQFYAKICDDYIGLEGEGEEQFMCLMFDEISSHHRRTGTISK